MAAKAITVLQEMFVFEKERIYNKRFPDTWWMSAKTWNKAADANTQAETLAGFHADYVLFILDESGGIPDAVMVAAEAAMSSCVASYRPGRQPAMHEGPLYRGW